jgi:DNA topoisomerase II
MPKEKKQSSNNDNNSSSNDTVIPKKGKKGVAVEDIYKMKQPIEHVLSLPDTYIGSIEPEEQELWIFDRNDEQIIKKKITFVPGLYKTFDELLVNTGDQTVRDSTCDEIRIYLDEKKGTITTWNNGNDIPPVVIHKEHGMYIPELIFCHLRTSANYDTKGKTTGGKNGYGAKLANIFSKKFIVEVSDPVNKKKFTQECTKNLSKIGEPVIETIKSSAKPYIKITYYPDFEKFNLDGMTSDIYDLFTRRVYDIAAYCTPWGKSKRKIKVYFNDKHIEIKTFEDYIKLHYKEETNIIYDGISDRWKVGVVFDPDVGHQQISFVNGISTYKGGPHVKYVLDQIADKIIAEVKKKHKLTAKNQTIKDMLTIFISSVIEDPAFTSQTKECLTNTLTKFGSTYTVPTSFMTKVYSSGIVEQVVKYTEFKENLSLKKTDGKKTRSVLGIEKLDDAKFAGTTKSKNTCLIITEGDSAKKFAVDGIEVLGDEYYGAWPIRGKFLNVRKATRETLQKNQEFLDFKKIMGLEQGVVYKDVSKLRYGSVLILTDQDLDGSHIKGLIINMLQVFWPSLLQIDGFVKTINTPVIKATKKSDTKKLHPKIFYTLSEYETWVRDELESDTSKWDIKYYKGLGTSTEKEAKEIFNDFENRVRNYVWETSGGEDFDISSDAIDAIDDDNDNEGNEEVKPKKKKVVKKKKKAVLEYDSTITDSLSFKKITMAFAEKAALRKVWLKDYNPDDILEYDKQDIPYSEFIDKDLIHFANYDNYRMIPSMCDGLKPSQRKILFGTMKKKLGRSEIKVNQLASYVSEHTAYKHGEASLYDAIINMAQNFPGSNNINLLFPAGNFGSRKMGGKDAASPRYIFTRLESIATKIYREEDNPILTYTEDDGQMVEPNNYAPIIPMALVNGVEGVGFGYSSTVCPFNPLDLANNMMRKLDDKEFTDMMPYFYKYTGKISQIEKNRYKMTGVYEIIDEETIKITEIPVTGKSMCTDKYKAFLETLVAKDKKDVNSKVIEVIPTVGNNIVHFLVKFKGNELQKLDKKGKDEIEKFLKLSTTFSTTNFNLYDSEGKMSLYDDATEIMDDFFVYRLDMYDKRKKYMIRYIENELKLLQYKVKFIKDILNEKIIIARQKKEAIIAKLVERKYPKLSLKISAVVQEGEIDEDLKPSYDYLTRMYLFSLTEEKIEELEKEYKAKQEEYDDYCNTSIQDMWRRELTEFLDEFKKWDAERVAYDEELGVGKGKKKRGKKNTQIEDEKVPTKTKASKSKSLKKSTK